jgi:hypothetical protein
MDSKHTSAKAKRTVAIVDAGRGRGIPGMVLDSFASKFGLRETSSKDADYVFHSCMGYDVLKYSGVRIFTAGECVTPDFNISDYAAAFERMDYGDRNCWLPLLRLYPDAYSFLKIPRANPNHVAESKSDFCAYTLSNIDDSAPERIEIFERLSEYKTVRSGGRWRNNTGGAVADKIAFQSQARFVIAFENQSRPGYLTEKFAEAAQSNAIPIYWGDPGVASVFNPEAFINCHEFPSLAEAVEEIKAIDADESRYRQMLAQPWFRNEIEPAHFSTERYEGFFASIFEQPLESAYRRNLSRWGKKYEHRLKTMAFNPLLQSGILLKTRIRKWKGSR